MSTGPVIAVLHRNLRFEDNLTLWRAHETGAPVLVIFALSDVQTHPTKNPFFAPASFAFMLQTLRDLPQVHIVRLRDPTRSSGWRRILSAAAPRAVYTAWDCTPFARRRADALRRASDAVGATFEEVREDVFLTDLDQIRTGSGTPYKVFTPFRNAVRSRPVPRPRGIPPLRHAPPPEAWEALRAELPVEAMRSPCPAPVVEGGRTHAERWLKGLRAQRDYETTRNLPAIDTSHLGPYLKFGVVSVREVWYRIVDTFGLKHPLLDQLVWREFFSYLAYHYPDTVLQPQYRTVQWGRDPAKLQAWSEGQTGVPLVDAGMRQLRQTGWMHGRVRMVVAQFLTKDLWIDWREGERVFARFLVDYDPSVNQGNWMWSAGVGADPPKYGAPRTFHPFLQAQRFDPEAVYIRRWIPELRGVPTRDILHWDTAHPRHVAKGVYRAPLVDHATATRDALAHFQRAADSA